MDAITIDNDRILVGFVAAMINEWLSDNER